MYSDRISEFVTKVLAIAAVAKASFVFDPTSPILVDLRAVHNSGYGSGYWEELKSVAALSNIVLTDGSWVASIQAQYA